MQAITTKYISATSNRTAHIRAACAAKRISIPYDYGLDEEMNHHKAAKELVRKLDWNPIAVHTGQLPTGEYAHVLQYR